MYRLRAGLLNASLLVVLLSPSTLPASCLCTGDSGEQVPDTLGVLEEQRSANLIEITSYFSRIVRLNSQLRRLVADEAHHARLQRAYRVFSMTVGREICTISNAVSASDLRAADHRISVDLGAYLDVAEELRATVRPESWPSQ